MLPHELRAVFVPFIAHSIRNYAATYAYVLFDKCQHDVNNLCAESSTVRSALFAPPIGSFGFTVSSAGRTHLLGHIPPSSPRQCVQSPREVHAALHENFRTWGSQWVSSTILLHSACTANLRSYSAMYEYRCAVLTRMPVSKTALQVTSVDHNNTWSSYSCSSSELLP